VHTTTDGENEMLGKNKVAAIALLVSFVLATTPLMLIAQGQMQNAPAEKILEIAEKAEDHVQTLIDLIDGDDEATGKIEEAGLTEEYLGNKALFESGMESLDAAQAAFDTDEEAAVESAVEALRIFRDVYSSIHVIMEEADIQKCDLTENQELLDAITRQLDRVERLKDILPDDAPLTILELLDDAEELLNHAETLLDSDVEAAKAALLDAKELISQVFDHLKEQAEESNEWRLRDYCEGLQERVRERFRYGQENGIDFAGALQSQGYQSESQYMTALQNSLQTAQSEQNFGETMQDCEQVSQMVQQMEQALNQEISRQQGQNSPSPGPGGSDSQTSPGPGSGGSGGNGP